MKTIIYGAGKYGRRLYGNFKTLGIGVDAFAQTKEPKDRTLDGIPVMSLDEMLRLDGDISVCMAIKDAVASAEAVKSISQATLGRGGLTVYDFSRFIDENPIVYETNHGNGQNQCNICGGSFDEFKPAGIKADIFKKWHIIGGGWRQGCVCPVCGAEDRERWQNHVLKEALGIGRMLGRILHFAPEPHIKKLIRSNPNIDYYTGDIVPGRAMHVTDITDLRQFSNSTFDLVICNHVMEHIPNEQKAVLEVKRVLKDDGKWMLSFPICTDIEETYEDESIDTPEKRFKAYGQKDHVRLYGRDYRKRFEAYGLKIIEYSPKEYFTKTDIEKFGFITDDVIMVAAKN